MMREGSGPLTEVGEPQRGLGKANWEIRSLCWGVEEGGKPWAWLRAASSESSWGSRRLRRPEREGQAET